jgi:hypothetical protein
VRFIPGSLSARRQPSGRFQVGDSLSAIPNLNLFATDLHRLSRIFKPKSVQIRETPHWRAAQVSVAGFVNWVGFYFRFGIAGFAVEWKTGRVEL